MSIQFQKVSKRYKDKYALKDFSAELDEGVYGLLGANGAGKTTLINIFVGILRGDGGKLLVDGQDAKKLGKSFLSQIGYMPQYPIFYRDFRVVEFLRYMCALKGIPEKQGDARIRELLSMTNLTEHKDKKIGALSGGMRQRVGIAQAMLSDPRFLILDEPTAGLDPNERIRFRNLISRFAQGRTILLATHIVSDVECIAKEIILLKEGELVIQGTPSVLEDSIKDKVWELTADDQEAMELSDRYCISNMKQEQESYKLRIVGDDCPLAGAQPAPPSLEDVFLYYFGGKSHDATDPI